MIIIRRRIRPMIVTLVTIATLTTIIITITTLIITALRTVGRNAHRASTSTIL
jgi:hypothetical protein